VGVRVPLTALIIFITYSIVDKKELKICPKCGKSFKGIKYHLWAKHSIEGKNFHPNKNRSSKLKGRKIGPKSLETRYKISINNRGWIKGNKCKWHEVKNSEGSTIKVQGTYEKRFAKILNILDPKWIKIHPLISNIKLEWFDENNILHNYFPDFWCPTLKKYFEVKGWYTDRDKIKMKYILSKYNNIEIIFLKDIQKYENDLNIK
jgi:hypothetical protein